MLKLEGYEDGIYINVNSMDVHLMGWWLRRDSKILEAKRYADARLCRCETMPMRDYADARLCRCGLLYPKINKHTCMLTYSLHITHN